LSADEYVLLNNLKLCPCLSVAIERHSSIAYRLQHAIDAGLTSALQQSLPVINAIVVRSVYDVNLSREHR